MSRPNLQVVDTDTGELVEGGCPECQILSRDLENLQLELRKALRRESELRADKEKEAEMHPKRQEIVQVFDYWRKECRHKNSKLDAHRTNLIAEKLKKYGLEMCLRAIDGAAFDPFITQRKNGTPKRHDGLKLIMDTAEKFEEFANKSPRPVSAKSVSPEPTDDVDPGEDLTLPV